MIPWPSAERCSPSARSLRGDGAATLLSPNPLLLEHVPATGVSPLPYGFVSRCSKLASDAGNFRRRRSRIQLFQVLRMLSLGVR